MKVFVLTLCIAYFVARSDAVSCECNLAKCPEINTENCNRGVTHDICKCCTVCAGDVGEHCGGPWGIFGSCGRDLQCKQSPCPSDVSEVDCYLYYLTDPGTCVELHHHSLVDILQGTHMKEATETIKKRRQTLLRELEALQKKKK